MDEVIIELKNVYYSYEDNDNSALNDINLKIKKGEVIAVMGANGSGKSTLFLNLNGVLSPDQGIIKLNNVIIKNNKILRRHVGIVFQDADSQIIASTVKSEVAFGPFNLKLAPDEVERRVSTALEYMNISHLANRTPHYLSGGEKKRVTIADIIAMESDVIIFDEPNASLDPLNLEMLEVVLQKLNAEGKTLIISTHDVDFAYRIANRVIVLKEGCVLEDDTASKVFKNKELLATSNLKQPSIFEIYEALVVSKYAEEKTVYPKTIEELKKCLFINKEKDNED
ncbi:MAG: energy-coupling factor ABC transporter ATP-binding protein [Bacilli bacterium]